MNYINDKYINDKIEAVMKKKIERIENLTYNIIQKKNDLNMIEFRDVEFLIDNFEPVYRANIIYQESDEIEYFMRYTNLFSNVYALVTQILESEGYTYNSKTNTFNQEKRL